MKISKILILSLFLFVFSNVQAQKLPSNSPEIIQLKAMGYEIDDTASSIYTLASSGSAKILISQNEYRTFFGRVFNRTKKLTQKEELQFYKLIIAYANDNMKIPQQN